MTAPAPAPALAGRVVAGDRRAIARAITLLESDDSSSAELVRAIFPHTGRAWLVGITGPPGAGKSTLVDRLIGELRRQRQTVGVVAVDPTSPFTGGAVLGDRLRMQAHAGDEGVFIRSMATRGHLGGLARATGDAALVLDAAGLDVVVIETVGVGQDEVDIVRMADVSVVTLVPGAGDEVQALKAGIMEIADVFVVNKADREGADRLVSAVEATLSLQHYGPGEWRPPIVKTIATSGSGVADLTAAIDAFRDWARRTPPTRPRGAPDVLSERRRVRGEHRLRDLMARQFMDDLERRVLAAGELDAMADRVAAREIDPYSAARELLDRPAASPDRQAPGLPTSIQAVLDHVGIAVSDLDAAREFYRGGLGLDIEPPEEVPEQGVRAHFVPVGPSASGPRLELIEATSAESPIARYLERRGPGLHHITLRVADVASVLARLKARGVRLIDETPRPGAEGSLVAFVHPSSAHGVLVELKQVASRGSKSRA